MSVINLHIKNKNPEKNVYIGVYNDESCWLKKPYIKLSTSNDIVSLNLTMGKYAILLIQDVFDNGEIIRDFWNKPINKIGVSICKDITEPPTFNKCSFDLYDDVTFNLSIELIKL